MENNTNNNLIKNENCKTNEDLEGLNDKYDDIGSIDEEIINNYIEEPKEINIENIIVKPKKRIKKPANNFKFELVIDKKSKNKLETEINNNMDINDNNKIDDNKEIENKSFNAINDKKENNINNANNISEDSNIIIKEIKNNINNSEEIDEKKKITKELIEKIDYGKINSIKDNNINYSQNIDLNMEKEINNNEDINNKDINNHIEIDNISDNNINNIYKEEEKSYIQNAQKQDLVKLNIDLIE